MAKKQRDALVWGIILVVIGLIFTLDNFDINVWDFVARLWPVVLIVWGAWKLYFGIKERNEAAAVPQEKQV
jgi:LiaF transmembrane domain